LAFLTSDFIQSVTENLYDIEPVHRDLGIGQVFGHAVEEGR